MQVSRFDFLVLSQISANTTTILDMFYFTIWLIFHPKDF